MSDDLEARTGEESGERVVPHARIVEDPAEFEAAPTRSADIHRPRWQLFLPTIAIAMLYLGAFLFLRASGLGGSSATRLVLIVLAVGVPLLAAHAFLRFETIRVQVLEDRLLYHPGWPRDLPIEMPFQLVESVRVRRGLSGMLFGGGTLVLHLTTGQKVAVADLADPEAAKREIDGRIA